MSKRKWYAKAFCLSVFLAVALVAVPMAGEAEADGEVTIFSEDFEGGLPGDWTVVTTAGCDWKDDDPGTRGAYDGCSGIFMIADSECCAPFDMDTELITPSIDCSAFATVVLEFDHYFKFAQFFGGNEKGDVDVWDGAIWHNKARYEAGTSSGHITIDISDLAAGKSSVKIRWHYYDAYLDYWWEVDNVELSAVPSAPPVGGAAYPVNKFGILVPWIALAAAIITGAILFTRRFRTQS